MGGQRHQGCSRNSQPGMQGVPSGPGEAAASIPPELEDALPPCVSMCDPKLQPVQVVLLEKKHIPECFEEHREL